MEATKLTNLQIELLKLYSSNISEAKLKEVKKFLQNLLVEEIDSEMDRLFEENGWGEEKIEEWKNGHYRKSK